MSQGRGRSFPRQGEFEQEQGARAARAAPSSPTERAPPRAKAAGRGAAAGCRSRPSQAQPISHGRKLLLADPGHPRQIVDGLKRPFASRSAMIFSAVAAPTPFRVSSSSAVAVLMLTRPSSPEGDRPPGSLASWEDAVRSAAPRGCRLIVDARRDDDLLTVLHLLGQVHRVGPRLVGGSSLPPSRRL